MAKIDCNEDCTEGGANTVARSSWRGAVGLAAAKLFSSRFMECTTVLQPHCGVLNT
jgi:hypothetical protein